jgi:hypothetical protein
MRKIKFRVWDGSKKEWLHDSDHAVNLFGETIIMGELLSRRNGGSVSLEELNDLTVMQFIGLQDKNGKDVFDGDIIINKHGAGERYPFIVIWKDKWAKFVLNLLPYQAEGKKERAIYQSIQCVPRWEVIGNIFDDNELLKKFNK